MPRAGRGWDRKNGPADRKFIPHYYRRDATWILISYLRVAVALFSIFTFTIFQIFSRGRSGNGTIVFPHTAFKVELGRELKCKYLFTFANHHAFSWNPFLSPSPTFPRFSSSKITPDPSQADPWQMEGQIGWQCEREWKPLWNFVPCEIFHSQKRAGSWWRWCGAKPEKCHLQLFCWFSGVFGKYNVVGGVTD